MVSIGKCFCYISVFGYRAIVQYKQHIDQWGTTVENYQILKSFLPTMFVPKHYIQLWWGRGGKHENNGVEDDDGEVDGK